jgi:uncharacterized protein (TIGR04255 family)
MMKIDTTEQFEPLPRAPIVEAVIQIDARPEISWDEKNISECLKPKLPDYEKIVSYNRITQEVKIAPHSPQTSEQSLRWHGLACQSKDETQKAQFNRDGFVFSRLQPYQNWDNFFTEAIRLWKIYSDTARPVEMQRIGLRFINRIQLPPKEVNFEKYIQPYPEPPFGLELPFLSFFHHDTLAVPGYPYAINVIRTTQPATNPQIEGIGLIIDIDAFTTQPLEIKAGALEDRLGELRWLKNKTFFGSVTAEAMKLFQ